MLGLRDLFLAFLQFRELRNTVAQLLELLFAFADRVFLFLGLT